MKALAILSLVFGALSIFIPVGGVFIALLCSVLALISFRSQPTLAGIAFGINIINTAFLSPSIMLADASNSGTFDRASEVITSERGGAGDIYWFYVGFHLVLLLAAVAWRLLKGPVQSTDA